MSLSLLIVLLQLFLLYYNCCNCIAIVLANVLVIAAIFVINGCYCYCYYSYCIANPAIALLLLLLLLPGLLLLLEMLALLLQVIHEFKAYQSKISQLMSEHLLCSKELLYQSVMGSKLINPIHLH